MSDTSVCRMATIQLGARVKGSTSSYNSETREMDKTSFEGQVFGQTHKGNSSWVFVLNGKGFIHQAHLYEIQLLNPEEDVKFEEAVSPPTRIEVSSGSPKVMDLVNEEDWS